MELTVEGLTKHYGSEWALREVSLRCEPSLVGLVGPNGAGKTTLLRIVATLLRPSAGVVRWKGQDIATHGRLLRAVLRYLPQEVVHPPGVRQTTTGTVELHSSPDPL